MYYYFGSLIIGTILKSKEFNCTLLQPPTNWAPDTLPYFLVDNFQWNYIFPDYILASGILGLKAK